MNTRLMMTLSAAALLGISTGPMLPFPDGPHLRTSKPMVSGPPGTRSKAERNKRKKARRMRGKRK